MITLAEARTKFMSEAQKQGSTCPCCNRFGKIYRRKINSGMSAVLILLYHHRAQSSFHHVPTLINSETPAAVAAAIRGDFAKLRYWDLLEEQALRVGESVVKRTSGKWRITDEGVQFVEGTLSVPKYVLVYNSEAFRTDGEYVSIHDTLRNKFSYAELMGHSTGYGA